MGMSHRVFHVAFSSHYTIYCARVPLLHHVFSVVQDDCDWFKETFSPLYTRVIMCGDRPFFSADTAQENGLAMRDYNDAECVNALCPDLYTDL